ELILHYTDPVTPEEKYHPMNLARKLQSPGITPIYMAGGIDISNWILENLNRRYTASSSAAPAAGPGHTGKQDYSYLPPPAPASGARGSRSALARLAKEAQGREKAQSPPAAHPGPAGRGRGRRLPDRRRRPAAVPAGPALHRGRLHAHRPAP